MPRNRYQRVKINNSYSLWSLTKHGVSQGSIHKYKVFATCLILENSSSQKRLGVTIDRKLNFNEHVTNLCDKASKKIQALARIFPYIPQTQKRLLMNAYFMSQFGYCPLVWMNHSRTLNNRINGLNKRAFSLVYNDFSSSFSELSEKDKSVTIQHRNL